MADPVQNPVRIGGNAFGNQIVGTLGDDLIDGGGGDDVLHGLDGNDVLHGRTGSDRLFGGRGDDVLHGGDWYDYLDGGDGADRLFGGEGHDHLFGRDGDDHLYGDGRPSDFATVGGTDVLTGGMGDDTLHGSDGFDLMLGNHGSDTFRFDFMWRAQGGELQGFRTTHTSIGDFQSGIDQLVVTATRWDEADEGGGLVVGFHDTLSFDDLDSNDDGVLSGADDAFVQAGGSLVLVLNALAGVNSAVATSGTIALSGVTELRPGDLGA